MAETTKHDWRRDEDGDVDIFAFSEGYHNGPACRRCGEFFCHHCHPECYDEPCVGQEDPAPLPTDRSQPS